MNAVADAMSGEQLSQSTGNTDELTALAKLEATAILDTSSLKSCRAQETPDMREQAPRWFDIFLMDSRLDALTQESTMQYIISEFAHIWKTVFASQESEVDMDHLHSVIIPWCTHRLCKVHHVCVSICDFNGKSCVLGAVSAKCTEHDRPYLFHGSRSLGFELAKLLGLQEQLRELSGIAEIMIPGVPGISKDLSGRTPDLVATFDPLPDNAKWISDVPLGC
jgi:hypothetical protein